MTLTVVVNGDKTHLDLPDGAGPNEAYRAILKHCEDRWGAGGTLSWPHHPAPPAGPGFTYKVGED